MQLPEPVEHASLWVCEQARKMKPDARFVAVLQMHGDVSAKAHPVLRDRTQEVVAMLRGMADDLKAEVVEEARSGRDWYAAGFRPEGAQYLHVYKILVT